LLKANLRRDKSVKREVTFILGGNKVLAVESRRSVTPYGGKAVPAEYLKKVGYADEVRSAMPTTLKSPNAIEPVETFTAFLISVLAGERRFAHAGMLRTERGLKALMGVKISERRYDPEFLQAIQTGEGA
jgi:hypothetical protein